MCPTNNTTRRWYGTANVLLCIRVKDMEAGATGIIYCIATEDDGRNFVQEVSLVEASLKDLPKPIADAIVKIAEAGAGNAK